MDNMSFRVLDIVMNMAAEGEFTVIDKNDILTQLGEYIEVEELDGIMENLELHDMIASKYTDENVYCIAPRPKGRLAFEKNKLLIRQKQVKNEAMSSEVKMQDSTIADLETINNQSYSVPSEAINYKKMAIICGISAFLGGFIAAVIVFVLERIF